jgi:hypothetical protein
VGAGPGGCGIGGLHVGQGVELLKNGSAEEAKGAGRGAMQRVGPRAFVIGKAPVARDK